MRNPFETSAAWSASGRQIFDAPHGVRGFVPGLYRWPVWWSVQRQPGVALAPEGHHRRCQARLKKREENLQCRQWALTGRRFCRAHGGRAPRTNEALRIVGYFSKNAGPALQAALEQAREGSPDEQLSLLEELAASRVLAGEIMIRFEAACLNPDNNVDDDTKALAFATMKNAIDHVTDIAVKAAKVRAASEGVVDVEALGYIVSQISRLVEHQCDERTARALIPLIKQVRMPEQRGNKSATAVAGDIIEAVAQMKAVGESGEREE